MAVEIKMSQNGVLLDLDIEGTPEGVLKGKTFVVKDLIDVKDTITGGGSPAWRATQKSASKNAKVVDMLLGEGARLKGKACTDELAMSLDGINPFYGTPLNTQLPDRIPDGSSSGSASAVAGGIVDFSIGTDTVGSIRVPASYCGIYGYRPSHGAVDVTGIMPLGRSFDTVGWFAQNSGLLRSVGEVLLPRREKSTKTRITKVLVARSLFHIISNDVCEGLLEAGDRIASQFDYVEEIELCQSLLESCAATFGIVRSAEAWRVYADWINNDDPALSPTLLQRIALGKSVDSSQEALGREMMKSIAEYFDRLIPEDTAILLPTAFGMPPYKSATKDQLIENRRNNLLLTAMSAVAGLPQASVPMEIAPKIKLGVSLMAKRHNDSSLLDVVSSLLES
ncbi:MAG: hypothetical protein K2X93_13870 [Candidatus Obscuribacterales bacterium]|nr:hypothetical protein [Candidatus Obscuribacterales bacterium]